MTEDLMFPVPPLNQELATRYGSRPAARPGIGVKTEVMWCEPCEQNRFGTGNKAELEKIKF